MRVRFLIALLVLALMGCTRVVTAPSPALPSPPDIPLRVSSLPADASIEAVLRAYVLDLAEQLGLSAQRKAIIDAHNKAAVAK